MVGVAERKIPYYYGKVIKSVQNYIYECVYVLNINEKAYIEILKIIPSYPISTTGSLVVQGVFIITVLLNFLI